MFTASNCSQSVIFLAAFKGRFKGHPELIDCWAYELKAQNLLLLPSAQLYTIRFAFFERWTVVPGQ